MASINENTPKANLTLISSIWMGFIGLAIILYNGIFISLNDSTKSFQETALTVLLGLIALVTAYGYRRENTWSIFTSIVVNIGAVFLTNGLHTFIYLLSAIITAGMLSVQLRFGKTIQPPEESNTNP